MKSALASLVAFLMTLCLIPVASTADAANYEGKTVTILVGTSPGGGFDRYARLLARHLGKHLEGNPAVIVENQPAAGGLVAANRLAKVIKPNGLTIATFNGTLLFDQLIGREGAAFDARKFEYIGALARVTPVFLLSKASGITNMDQWMASKTPVKLGGLGPGNLAPDNTPRILAATIGLPIQLVTGYKGTSEVHLAVSSNEVAGSCLGWESAKKGWRADLDSGNAAVILQAVPKPLPDLQNVPLAISYAKTPEARQLIEVGIHHNGMFARPFLVTPGTPKPIVEQLRTAFEETIQDKDFLADAAKSKLDLNPATGQALKQAVMSIGELDPRVIARLKEILFK